MRVLVIVGTAGAAMLTAAALAGCSPAAIRINGCPPRALPPTPDVVSVPASDCPAALCFDAENAAALKRKLAILEDAASR